MKKYRVYNRAYNPKTKKFIGSKYSSGIMSTSRAKAKSEGLKGARTWNKSQGTKTYIVKVIDVKEVKARKKRQQRFNFF